jgi:hypothetical protein
MSGKFRKCYIFEIDILYIIKTYNHKKLWHQLNLDYEVKQTKTYQ